MAAGIFKGLTIKFDGNTTALSSALKSVQSDARKTQNDLKKIQTAMKYNPGSQALMGRSIQLMEKKLQTAKKELDTLYEAAEKGPENMSTEAWSQLQAQIDIAKGKVRDFSKELAQAYIKMDASNSTLGKVGQALQDFGERNEKMAQRLQSAGSIMTRGITMPLVAAGAASVAAAIKIDDSLTGVRKTVDGTAEQYAQLKQAAIDFSKTNAVSASQILDIQALGGQLGFTVDELQEFSEVVSGLGVSTDLSFEQAATEMAQFANITKMSHADVSRYGSAIVDLGNHFATTESKISAMAMRIAAAGTQVGMSQADILGLATALSSMGIEAEAGGTAISTIMAQIDKDVSTGSASMETWASTAKMSASEFAAAWQTNPVEALTAVLSGMEEATNAGGNMSLMLDELGISSLRQTDVMKRLAGNSELVGRAVSTANQAWAENTALQAEVDNRNQSLASQFEMLKNRIIAIADSFGGPLAQALLDILDAAEPLFQAIADGAQAFADMDKGAQQTILTVVGLVAALGPLTSGFGRLIGSAKTIGQTLSGAAQLFARLGGAGRQAGQGLEAAARASAGMQKSVGMSATALGALKAGLAGLGVAAAATLIASWAQEAEEAARHAENLATVADGLGDAMDALNGTVEESAEAAESYSMSLDGMRDQTREAAQSQADFYRSMKEVFAEAGAKVSTLDAYYDVIDRLYGRTDLTAAEQNELANALKQVGDATGQSLPMVQDGNGAFVAMGDGAAYAKDQILGLIEAQQMQIRSEAVTSKLTDSMAEEQSIAEKLNEAYGVLAEKKKAAEEVDEQYFNTERDRIAAQNDANREVAEAQEIVDGYVRALSTQKATTQAIIDQQALYESALRKGAGSVEYAVASNEQLVQGLVKANRSTVDFAAQLEAAGVSAEEFGTLGTDVIYDILESYNGSFSSIAGILAEHGIHMSDAAMATYQAFSQMSQDADLAVANMNGAFLGIQGGKDAFVQAIAEAGFSVEQFAALTPEQMAVVAAAMQSGTQDWQAIMRGFVDSQSATGEQVGMNLQNGMEAGMSGIDMVLANHLTAMDANAAEAAGMPNTVQVFNEATDQFETAASDMVFSTNEEFARLGPEVSATVASGGEQISAAAQSVAQSVPTTFDGIVSRVAAAGSQVGPAYSNAIAGGAGAVTGSGQVLVNAAAAALNSGTPRFAQAGLQSGQGYGASIQSTQGDTVSKAQAIVAAVAQMLQSGIPKAKDAGGRSGQGYASAIGGSQGAASSAGSRLGSAAVSAMQGYVSAARAAGAAVGSAFAAAVSAASSAARISAPSMPSVATIAAVGRRPVMPVPVAAVPLPNGVMPMSADSIRSSIESTVGKVFDQAQRTVAATSRRRSDRPRSEASGLTEADVAKIIDAMQGQFSFTANIVVNERTLATTTAAANDRAIGALKVRRSR